MYDITGIPGLGRELITAFQPAFQAFASDRRVQSEEFLLFSDRLVQSELRVFKLCASCLRHVDLFSSVYLPRIYEEISCVRVACYLLTVYC